MNNFNVFLEDSSEFDLFMNTVDQLYFKYAKHYCDCSSDESNFFWKTAKMEMDRCKPWDTNDLLDYIQTNSSNFEIVDW